MFMKSCKKDKGFTLIELLVVISVIALLMAILVPVLNKAKAYARQVICMSYVKQWGVYSILYAESNQGKTVLFTKKDDLLEWNGSGSKTWMPKLKKYIDAEEKVALCPSTTRTENEGESRLAKQIWQETLTHKTTREKWVIRNSIGINNWIYSLYPGENKKLSGMDSDFKNKIWGHTHYKSASNIPLFLESYRWGGVVNSRDDEPRIKENARKDSFDRFCIDRHNAHVNICFLDGSVRKVGLKFLWNLKWHRKYKTRGSYPTWPKWMLSMKEPPRH